MSNKYNEKYWREELQRSREKRGDFEKAAEESEKVYSGEKILDDCERTLSVWWYLVETLLPAYCSRMPKVEVQLRKKAGSNLYQIGATAIERFTQYGLDEFFDFMRLGVDSARQFLITGQAVLWARYEAQVVDKEFEYALARKEGKLYKADGEEYEGEGEVVEEREGMVSMREIVPSKQGEKACLDLVHYKDFCESVARTESEVYWRSRRAYMSRDEVTAKFGKEISDSLTYDTVPDDTRRDRDVSLYEGKAELEEIWCRESDKVYYIAARGDKSILEESEPPIRFEGFYPCSVISSSVTPSSTIPISDFTEVRDQVLEVERLTTRVHAMTQAVRANFAYDKAMGTEIEGLFSGDLKGIPVANWPSYKARGGLQSSIEGLPIERYIQCLEVLTQTRDATLMRLYDTLKASDIVRGNTSPIETATAQQLKSNWASLGLSVRQNIFGAFISNAIEKLGTVMLSKFSDETLKQMADGDQLLASAQLGPEMWPQFIAELKREPLRSYRIRIAADSLVALDEQADKQSRLELLQAFGSFLGQLTPMIEQYPAIAPYAMQLMQFATRGFKSAKEVEEFTQGALATVIQAAQQKAQQQAQTPPTPGVIESQTRLQIAQLQAQTDQAKLQLEQYRVQLEAQIKNSELQLAQAQLALEQSKAQADVAYRGKEIEVKTAQIVTDSQLKQTEMALKQRMQELESTIELQKAETQKYLAQLDGYEKLLEERRLATEDRVRAVKDMAPSLPPINIQVDATKSGKRTGRVTRDALGGAVLEIDEVK